MTQELEPLAIAIQHAVVAAWMAQRQQQLVVHAYVHRDRHISSSHAEVQDRKSHMRASYTGVPRMPGPLTAAESCS
jgi:hypothetical protein